MRRVLITLIAVLTSSLLAAPAIADEVDPPRVLLITAHPDDETLFNLGRFAERGWPMAVALVTNGEGGSVVQAIRPDYDPARDPDILIEAQPGPSAWLTRPPGGPRLRQILTPTALAVQRRREFLTNMAYHKVSRVYFLSTPRNPAFDDNWDAGIHHWRRPHLRQDLIRVAARFRPTLIVTLNPDETWAHPQHVGLGRLVRKWHAAGLFGPQAGLYGLREHAWYDTSLTPQTGDLRFNRLAYSPVLRATYEEYWTTATGAYISQSSHPVWLRARAEAGILPGYRGIDLLRTIDAGSPRLQTLFTRFPPSRHAMAELPGKPRVIRFGG